MSPSQDTAAQDAALAAASAKPVFTLAQISAQLTRTGSRWPSSTITYSFFASNPGSAYGQESSGFSVFTDAQKTAARLALSLWAAVAKVTFTEVADTNGGGQIRFGDTTSGPAQAWTYLPGSAAQSGDVWVNPTQASNAQFSPSQYGLTTLIHELGHALGLSHPGNYDATQGTPTYAANAIYAQDSLEFTIMSYFSASNTGGYDASAYPSTPLLDDIAAVQSIYGANTSTRTGDTTYGFHSNAGVSSFDFTVDTTPVVTIWDGGGADTLDLSGFSHFSRIDLNQGAFSDAAGMLDNIAIAYGTDIENAIGGPGNDVITGNALDNVLTGGLGNDTIDGGGGTNTAAYSGPGAAYSVTKAGSVYTVSGPDGTDTLTNIQLLQFNGGTPIAIDSLLNRHTITFAEYPVGSLDPSYIFADETVFLSGRIVANATVAGAPASSNPAAAASPALSGPIILNLLRPVTGISFLVQSQDTAGSVAIDVYAADGSVALHQVNTAAGTTTIALDSAVGIAGVRVTDSGSNGASIDTVTLGPVASVAQPTSLSIVSPVISRYEGQAGTTAFTFTVDRSGSLSGATTASWAVSGTQGSSFAGGTLPSGTIAFAANETTKTITVAVAGNTLLEADKTFTLSLFDASAGTALAAPVAAGTILNDDQATPSTTQVFAFNFADATIRWMDTAVIVSGPDGSVTALSGVTTFVFNDGTIDETTGSPLVDKLFYYANNKDVWAAHMDAETHYDLLGWKEGRDPNAYFSTSGYLAANPDVKAAGLNPLLHFDQYGWKEGRDPSAGFDDTLFLLRNAGVKALGIDPLAEFLQTGRAQGQSAIATIGTVITHGSFDAQYYLLANPDVARSVPAGTDPYEFAYQHYEAFGWHEGRNPNAEFDVRGYLAKYTDVAAAHVDPLAHYDQFGWKEGRDPSGLFDTGQYLLHNADVAAAGADPLQHYLMYGATEGRAIYPDLKFA